MREGDVEKITSRRMIEGEEERDRHTLPYRWKQGLIFTKDLGVVAKTNIRETSL